LKKGREAATLLSEPTHEKRGVRLSSMIPLQRGKRKAAGLGCLYVNWDGRRKRNLGK